MTYGRAATLPFSFVTDSSLGPIGLTRFHNPSSPIKNHAKTHALHFAGRDTLPALKRQIGLSERSVFCTLTAVV